MFTLAELEDVIPLVRAGVPPTPQYAWPLLKVLTGVESVVKHENHEVYLEHCTTFCGLPRSNSWPLFRPLAGRGLKKELKTARLRWN